MLKLNENMKTYLAYSALIYTIAAGLYLFITFAFIGSPWAEAVRKLPAETRAIRKRSARTRGAVYGGASAVAMLTVALWRPFAHRRA